MIKNIVRTLLMSTAIAVFTTGTQASQDAEAGGIRESRQEQRSIVGSWMGTLDNGERLLISFTADGIVFSSVQGEVKLTQPVLTPTHGAWIQLTNRRIAFTLVGALYDIQTGADQGTGKFRARLNLDQTGDRVNGAVEVDLFSPDGTPIAVIPHTLSLTRITVEPLD